MNAHLYIVEHVIDGERYVSAVVGDTEMKLHLEMARSFGAELKDVLDVENELYRFVWDCCFEGLSRGWLDA